MNEANLMKTNELTTGNMNLTIAALGLVFALLVFTALTGRKIPLLSSERAVVVALVVIGMAICSQGGIGRVAAIGAWSHPFAILAYIIGATILLIGIAALFGKPLPPLANFHQAILTITGLAVIKLVITAIHRLFL
jgi:hypothetical protein